MLGGGDGIAMTTAAAPISRKERIPELDIIRGFALFGVLWGNLLLHSWYAIPEAQLEALATARFDAVTEFLGRWLVASKAAVLFSMLFGFGFAVMIDRLEAQGGAARGIYARRLAVLFLFGLAHLLLLWTADVLHTYALAGIALLVVRRWRARLLLGLAILLAVALAPLLNFAIALRGGVSNAAAATAAENPEVVRRFELLQGSDYTAFVGENAAAALADVANQPVGLVMLSIVLGRFLLGAWIYRQGWLHDIPRHAGAFRRAAAILLVLGLGLSALSLVLGREYYVGGGALRLVFSISAYLAPLLLALGYCAGIILLCRNERRLRLLSPIGDAGRMALTNYVAQSFVFLFVLYGFGLGLLPYCGATFSLVLALVVFALQAGFSRWWLARFRFGPLEWLWRTLTYGERQPMRRSGD
jgi:uncharacterized protein